MLYLRSELSPATITPMLNEKFKTQFTLVQVQRLINDRWSKKRKVLVERRRAIETKTDAQIVKATAQSHKRIMERFAGKTEKLADKALDMATGAGDARTMQAAASAAKSAITMFRVCSGIDSTNTGGPRAATFNFNFGNVVPAIAEDSGPVLEAQVVDAAPDEDDEDESYDEEDDVRV
jgi:hypothetical protein